MLGELGDYDPAEHTEGYVSGYRFVPNQVLCGGVYVCRVLYADFTGIIQIC